MSAIFDCYVQQQSKYRFAPSPVPEPGTVLLVGSGVLAVGAPQSDAEPLVAAGTSQNRRDKR